MDDSPLEKTRLMSHQELAVNAKEQPSRRRFSVYLVPLAVIAFAVFTPIALLCNHAMGVNSPPPPPPPAPTAPAEIAECRAERVVAIGGVESREGDDGITRDLSLEMRLASGSQPGWLTSWVRVSMAMMVIANECDPRMMSCLRLIAAELEADRLVFGYLHRLPLLDDPDSYEYEYEVFCYDYEANDIVAVSRGTSSFGNISETFRVAHTVVADCLD